VAVSTAVALAHIHWDHAAAFRNGTVDVLELHGRVADVKAIAEHIIDAAKSAFTG
jgi:hypothetical protein